MARKETGTIAPSIHINKGYAGLAIYIAGVAGFWWLTIDGEQMQGLAIFWPVVPLMALVGIMLVVGLVAALVAGSLALATWARHDFHQAYSRYHEGVFVWPGIGAIVLLVAMIVVLPVAWVVGIGAAALGLCCFLYGKYWT